MHAGTCSAPALSVYSLAGKWASPGATRASERTQSALPTQPTCTNTCCARMTTCHARPVPCCPLQLHHTWTDALRPTLTAHRHAPARHPPTNL